MKDQMKGILSRQRYQQLTSEELVELSELCNDEVDREVLQGIFSALDHLDSETAMQPNDETKKQLNRLFESIHFNHRESNSGVERLKTFLFPPERPLWLSPVVSIAAVVVVVFLGIQFWSNDMTAIKANGMQTASLTTLDSPPIPSTNDKWEEETPLKKNGEENQKMNNMITDKDDGNRSVSATFVEEVYAASMQYTDMESGNVAESSQNISNQPAEESVSFRFMDYPEMIELITASY